MKNFLIVLLLLVCTPSFSQLGLGTIYPKANAALDISSTSKGLLFPRMTYDQRNLITSPVAGLTIWCTNCGDGEFQIYDGFSWTKSTGGKVSPPTVDLGINFWSHFNGVPLGTGIYGFDEYTVTHTTGQFFSGYSACQDKSISSRNTTCPTSVTGSSGTVYPIVLINGQCWMSSDLNEIPSNYPTNSAVLSQTDTGNYGYYNYSDASGNSGWGTTLTVAGQGLMYQWSAAMNGSTEERARGACPYGYHIPSDCEWSFLEHGLGMNIAQQNIYWSINQTTERFRDEEIITEYEYFIGGKVSKKLRSNVCCSGTNASGFTATFNGIRSNIDGSFLYSNSQQQLRSYYWSSSKWNPTYIYIRGLNNVSNGVLRSNYYPSFAMSVRCLKN